MKRIALSKPLHLKHAPQPPIPAELQAAVVAALRWAWPLVQTERGVNPMEHTEETITAGIEALLNEKRDGRRRAKWLRLFKDVARSAQYRGSQGSFRQTPDLRFQPRQEPRDVTDLSAWGLFAECKIVGPSRHHSPSEYCENGVGRFVSGNYAPRMSSALMVAYVRDGRTARPTLEPLLNGTFGNATVRDHQADSSLLLSRHDRTRLNPQCVAIELTHLWLDARPAPGS